MKKGMKYFQELGDKIDDAWKKSLNDERAFPAIAEAALLENPPHLFVDPHDVIEWGLTARSMGMQHGGGVDFGEPPVIVYRARRFYIEVLFWFDGTTSIHQHAFDGAFCVLGGSSVHSRYDFRETDRTSTRLVFGDVEFRYAELLKQGSVHQILSADKFIHALFHLDHPSVSIVVRTDHTQGSVQYSYSPPYMGVDPFDSTVVNRRAVQFLRALRLLKSERATELTRRGFECLDDLGVMNAMLVLSQWKDDVVAGAGEETESKEPPKDAKGIAAAEKAEKDKATVLAMYDAAEAVTKARFGALWPALEASFAETLRTTQLVLARSRVHDPELRFFLALLMNVPDRPRLLELVEERFPGSDPVDTVLRWLSALSDGTTLEYELGDDTLKLLGFLIRGATPREAGQQLAKVHQRDFSSEEIEAIEETISELKKVPIFRALLVTEKPLRIHALLNR
ncbi:MAG: hypothetical protein U0174_22315 [Polyangiaceae bacterium]